MDFEVLPSRGFDIGATWFRGIPISWFSPVTDAHALPATSEVEWLTWFTGGLLSTCGFHHIGAPTRGHGMHHSASRLAADEVSWRIEEHGREPRLALNGTVENASLFVPSFRMRRTIDATNALDGSAVLRVVEEVTNIGPATAPLSLLYHLDLGAPLFVAGTGVDIENLGVTAAGPHPEVPDWRVLPEPVDHLAEARLPPPRRRG